MRLASVLDGCRHWIAERTRSAPPPEAALEQCYWLLLPQEVRRLIESPTLALVEPVDDHVWHRYRTKIVDLARAPQRTPHMLVRRGDTVFTSVMLFLRKAAQPAGA